MRRIETEHKLQVRGSMLKCFGEKIPYYYGYFNLDEEYTKVQLSQLSPINVSCFPLGSRLRAYELNSFCTKLNLKMSSVKKPNTQATCSWALSP